MFSVGGRALQPVSVRGGVHTFVVPAGVETILLLSHATAPSEVAPWVDDSRTLVGHTWRRWEQQHFKARVIQRIWQRPAQAGADCPAQTSASRTLAHVSLQARRRVMSMEWG